MKITAHILIVTFIGLFISSFIIGPFPMPGIFYLLPAIFVLTTLQLFEKGKIREGILNGLCTAMFVGMTVTSFIT
ncbi:hypothetical protein [Jeotgalibacillus sp. JSM ZJ347]|uniref:hypothetical protein n=1 Tax=Jeotgalibacillus sp. JSM ZJ347 TaxID=3342117 RepID=UPI0035A97539